MAIRTFTAPERYSRNRGGGTESGKKLKKLKSVKVANLDRLRLSMKREKSWFRHSHMSSSDYAYGPSETSSATMSGTSSPNYMKATSSSARKGSLQSTPGNIPFDSASRKSSLTSTPKSTSRLSKVSVEGYSDPVDVHIPVDIKPRKSIKRVPSLKHSKKLSSLKSMKIRTKYSQFQDAGFNQAGTSGLSIEEYQHNADAIGEEMDPEGIPGGSNRSDPYGQKSMVRVGAKQKGILERTRSIKLTRLRSKRFSRRQPQSRLSEAGKHMSYKPETSTAEPRYMKGTTSHEARKNSANGLTRTASLRPKWILAKVPSLRPRRSKVRKHVVVTPLPSISVDRATCSSTLKRSEFPEHIELRGQESEGTSFFHVCPYSYCSLNGHHHHHAPSPPLKEFISAKRELLNDQKGKQLESQSRQMISSEAYGAEEVMNAMTVDAAAEEDPGPDFLIKIDAKPRKKWAVGGTSRKDSDALNSFGCSQANVGCYEGKIPETVREIAGQEERQVTCNGGQPEVNEVFSVCKDEADNEYQQQTGNAASLNYTNELLIRDAEIHSSLEEHLQLPCSDPKVSPAGDLISILSDKQKYTSIWHLIYQQFVPSDAAKTGIEGVNGTDENDDGDCPKINELCQGPRKCNKNLDSNEDDQETASDTLEFDQTEAVKLVQEALEAMLQRDAESSDQQPIVEREVGKQISTLTVLTEENLRKVDPITEKETNLRSEDEQPKLKLTGAALKQKVDPNEGDMSGGQISKSHGKLRRLFVTVKLIKTVERLTKINPRKPRFLPAEPTSEEERVYLRHLSMKERNSTEEWMLDYALRQAILRLSPDQQRRVTKLVEAFETVTPDQKGKGGRHFPVKGQPASGNDSPTPTDKEPKQFVEADQTTSKSDEQVILKQHHGMLLSHKSVPKQNTLGEDHDSQAKPTGNKNVQGSQETNISQSSLDLPQDSCKTPSMNTVYPERRMISEELVSTVEVPSQFSSGNSQVSGVGEMTNIFSNKQKYSSMWNLIYQHVVTSEASTDEMPEVNAVDEIEQGSDANKCLEIINSESIQGSYSSIHERDADKQGSAYKEHQLDQSDAVKLVKEALNAILKHYEQSNSQQSIQYPHRAAGDAAESAEENSRQRDEEVGKHTLSESEDKVEKTNLTLQQQVEPNQLETPQKKMSKTYSRLKKAIVTAKFIKAIEQLRNSSLHKSQSLSADAVSKKERVYLRHLSMNGKQNNEECMLDYALRQVISKMGPDQQRRVALLVEAFETVTPEQKEKSTRCSPLKIEAASAATPSSEGTTSISDKQEQQVPVNHDDGDRSQQKNHVQLASTAGSTFDLSQNSSESASAGVTLKERSNGNEETMRAAKLSSHFPTESYEVKPEGDIDNILFDKQKYTSMWHLIYQQVTSNEESMAAKQELNEVDEEDKGENDIKSQEMKDPYSNQSTCVNELGKVEDNRSAARDQSAAIKLVKEAIQAILQGHEQRSDTRSLRDHDIASDNSKELCHKYAPASTEENSREGEKQAQKHRNSETEDRLHKEKTTSAPLTEQAEVNTVQRGMSKSHSKLKKMIVTVKFINAMERMKKNSWRKPRHLSPEAASHEERVRLRHLSINGRRNDEEWMLDYALRKVISDLPPDQQRKVALLVDAFENVNPKQKENSVKRHIKDDRAPTIQSETMKGRIESEKDNSMLYDDSTPLKHENKFRLRKGPSSERSLKEDHGTEISNFRMEISSCEAPVSDDIKLHSNHQASSEGSPVCDPLRKSTVTEEGTEPNPIPESLQNASLSINSQQDYENNIAKGIFSDQKKNTSMWHLIYQQVNPVSVAEAGSKLSEILGNDDCMNRDSTTLEMMADSDIDDSDTSSVMSELNENDAITLVKEAIDDILDVPQDHDKELLSSISTTAFQKDQNTAVGEIPEKSLSRGYSKLRKLIICNKFIKAMQKMQKVQPRKHKNFASHSVQEAGNTQLKASAAGERKTTEEMMLDNVLQKVISGLAPVQQRRVALLVEAFEKVKPDIGKRGMGLSNMKNKSSDDISSAGNAKKKDDTVSGLSQNSNEISDGFNLKIDSSVTTAGRDLAIDKAEQDILEDETPSLSIELVTNGEEMRDDGLCNITATPSDVVRVPSDTKKEQAEVNWAEKPEILLKERTSVGGNSVENSDQATQIVEKPSRPEDEKYKENHSLSLDKKKVTSLWGLILQHETASSSNELETNWEEMGDHDLCNITAKPSDVVRTPSETWKEPAEVNWAAKPEILLKDRTFVGGQLVENSDQATQFVEKPSQPEDAKYEDTHSLSSDKEKFTSLWGLILQHVKTDNPETIETQIPAEIAGNEQACSVKVLVEKNTDETSQLSQGVDHDDTDILTPTSSKFEENEAIKLVQEAFDEMLLLPDEISDDQSHSVSATSEKDVGNHNHGNDREISPATKAISGETIIPIPEEQRTAPKENFPKNFSKLRNVIMCKRFIKALDKMQKLRPQPPRNLSQPPNSGAEGSPSLRQTATSGKKSWEEGMLDHALQQVVGKLAPAQKKRVALLVQAFETVGSQPDITSTQRGNIAVS